jgi:hypothetical protein
MDNPQTADSVNHGKGIQVRKYHSVPDTESSRIFPPYLASHMELGLKGDFSILEIDCNSLIFPYPEGEAKEDLDTGFRRHGSASTTLMGV